MRVGFHDAHGGDQPGTYLAGCHECEVATALWCDYCGALVRRAKYKDHRFTHGIVDLPDDPDT